MCYKNHKNLFTYRIREKNDGEGYVNRPILKDGLKTIPSKFRFVQNIFGLLTLSVKNCLVIRNPKELLLWDNKSVHRMGLTTNIKLVEDTMLEKAKEFALKFNRDISSIGLDKIFEGYVSKYYNVKDYEQYLFGQQEISPLNSQVNLYSQRYDDGFISRNTSSRNSQSRRSSN